MKSSFAESGAVSSTDVLVALVALGRGAVSATVRFAGPAGESIVYGLEEGVLVALETPPENAPAENLLRAGKIQRPTYEALTVGDFEDRFAVAAASGLISKREVNWGMKISAIESLVRVLSWTEGSYLFEEGHPAPTAPPLRLGVDQWILELFLRSNDRGFVLRRAGATDIAIGRTPAFAEGFSSLGLTADADAVVEAVDGKRSIEQIVKRSRAEEFATLKLLAALVTLGLIRPVLETPLEGPPEPSGDAEGPSEPEGFTEPAEDVAALAASESSPADALSGAAPEESPPETPAWEPEPVPEEVRHEPAILDAEIAETPASAEVEPRIAPDHASREERPPRPSREIPNLPLFALTVPEPEVVDEFVSGTESEPPAEGRVVPTPRPRWPWLAAAAGAAVLSAVLVLRRAGGPGREGAAVQPRAAVPETSAPAREARTTAVPPAAPVSSSPAPAIPPPASARPREAPTGRPMSPPAPLPSRREAAASPRPETSRPDPSDRRWRDLAQAGGRKFDHPGRYRYAIQLELACETGTLEKAFAADRGSKRMWLAPYSFRDRSCYRVLWGRFADLPSARSGKRDIPAMFSAGGNRPTIVALGKGGRTSPKRRRSR